MIRRVWIAALCAGGPAFAAVDGDPGLALELSRTLGDATPEARVTVERAGDAVRVEIADASGRAVARVVPTIGAAAIWVESWTSSLALPLLRAPPPKTAELAPVVRVPFRAPSLPRLEVAVAPSDRVARFAGRAELAVGQSDLLYGGAVRGAADVGPVSVGGIGRVATGARAKTDAFGPSRRLAGEILVEVGWPVEVGPFELEPRAGAGLGIARTSGASIEPVAHATVRPRIEIGLGAAVSIVALTRLDLDVGFSLAPGARSGPLLPDGVAPGDVGTDPASKEKIARLSLPGEPLWLFRVGLGLRFDLAGGGS